MRANEFLTDGEVLSFPKKHPHELLTNCPKCGGTLQGGKDAQGRLKLCMPCMTIYRAPNQDIPNQPLDEAAGGTTFYHVTKTATVPSIQAKGITGMNPTNFVKGNGEQYGNIGEIFCMTSKKDAIRWAAKWEWELNKSMGKGVVSIVEFTDDPKGWKVDKSDPLSQAGNEGKWLKKKNAHIPPEQILGAEPVNIDMIKASRL